MTSKQDSSSAEMVIMGKTAHGTFLLRDAVCDVDPHSVLLKLFSTEQWSIMIMLTEVMLKIMVQKPI